MRIESDATLERACVERDDTRFTHTEWTRRLSPTARTHPDNQHNGLYESAHGADGSAAFYPGLTRK
jgi:hypothetical protein